MDWAGIEELVYSEASDPGRLLGEHVIKEGLLIQAFLPNAEKVACSSVRTPCLRTYSSSRWAQFPYTRGCSRPLVG